MNGVRRNSIQSAIQSLLAIRPLFPPGIADELSRSATVRMLESGQVLYSEGSEVINVYIVAQGTLRSILTDQEGREQILAVERPGAVLGSVGVFTKGGYISTVVAEGAATLLCVDTRVMKKLCRDHVEWMWSMAAELAERVRAYAELASMLSLRNADQKLAFYLLTIAQDRGVQTDGGLLVELTATRMDIATRLGTVREVISRSMAHLQEKRLVSLKGRLVTVPSIAALRRFATGPKEAPLKARSSNSVT